MKLLCSVHSKVGSTVPTVRLTTKRRLIRVGLDFFCRQSGGKITFRARSDRYLTVILQLGWCICMASDHTTTTTITTTTTTRHHHLHHSHHHHHCHRHHHPRHWRSNNNDNNTTNTHTQRHKTQPLSTTTLNVHSNNRGGRRWQQRPTRGEGLLERMTLVPGVVDVDVDVDDEEVVGYLHCNRASMIQQQQPQAQQQAPPQPGGRINVSPPSPSPPAQQVTESQVIISSPTTTTATLQHHRQDQVAADLTIQRDTSIGFRNWSTTSDSTQFAKAKRPICVQESGTQTITELILRMSWTLIVLFQSNLWLKAFEKICGNQGNDR